MNAKTDHNRLLIIFAFSAALTIVFFVATFIIFKRSYSDPRWRVFDYNSRQATEADIYNVAEIPAISKVEFAGKRKLRFEFTPPVDTDSWTIRSEKDGSVFYQGSEPEIQFPDEPYTNTFRFEPSGVTLARDITITISFYPGERYRQAGLSWPDNYYSPSANVPFSLNKAWSIDEWAGLPDNDPDIAEARRLMQGEIDLNAPVVERSEQVFRFVMNGIVNASGTPTDDLQYASPLETWRMLSSGKGKGWCENRALVYYLFANAAGVKTRLIDMAGKFGPLKLTGHYFCESWDPDQCRWFMVDPMSSVAHVNTNGGRLLSTLDIKRLFDLDAIGSCSAVYFDSSTGNVSHGAIDRYENGNRGYYSGDIVIAYKFGYPKNKTFQEINHFLFYPTLLYATFDLPDLYRFKQFCIGGLVICFIGTIISGFHLAVRLIKRGDTPHI